MKYRTGVFKNIKSGIFICFFFYALLTSCSQDKIVEEYFQDHGMTYPVDVSGVGLLGIKYVGIEDDEMLVDGASEFVQDGIMYIKVYFKHGNVNSHFPGMNALVVRNPVFYKGESGEVGIMVKVVAYGRGEPGEKIHLDIEWMTPDKKFWRVENFAYFNRNSLYKWQYGGWVFK